MECSGDRVSPALSKTQASAGRKRCHTALVIDLDKEKNNNQIRSGMPCRVGYARKCE